MYEQTRQKWLIRQQELMAEKFQKEIEAEKQRILNSKTEQSSETRLEMFEATSREIGEYNQ